MDRRLPIDFPWLRLLVARCICHASFFGQLFPHWVSSGALASPWEIAGYMQAPQHNNGFVTPWHSPTRAPKPGAKYKMSSLLRIRTESLNSKLFISVSPGHPRGDSRCFLPKRVGCRSANSSSSSFDRERGPVPLRLVNFSPDIPRQVHRSSELSGVCCLRVSAKLCH